MPTSPPDDDSASSGCAGTGRPVLCVTDRPGTAQKYHQHSASISHPPKAPFIPSIITPHYAHNGRRTRFPAILQRGIASALDHPREAVSPVSNRPQLFHRRRLKRERATLCPPRRPARLLSRAPRSRAAGCLGRLSRVGYGLGRRGSAEAGQIPPELFDPMCARPTTTLEGPFLECPPDCPRCGTKLHTRWQSWGRKNDRRRSTGVSLFCFDAKPLTSAGSTPTSWPPSAESEQSCYASGSSRVTIPARRSPSITGRRRAPFSGFSASWLRREGAGELPRIAKGLQIQQDQIGALVTFPALDQLIAGDSPPVHDRHEVDIPRPSRLP
jgi:hypothetical protein